MTDHHALCCLLSKKDLAERLARWATVVQGENLKIIHKSGKAHSDADALSRYPVAGGENDIDEENNNYLPMCNITTIPGNLIEDLPDLQKAQLEDAVFGKLYKSIENAEGDNKQKNNYVILNGILYRKKIKNANVSLQVCVPRCSIPRVLTNYHDHIITGHMGQNRTLERITKRFHWNGMEKEIRAYIRSCLSCQMRKAVPDKPAGFMSYIEADYPFHKVGIDLLGPFPETQKQKKYVIVAVDYITKWTETDSLPNGTAEEAAQFFVRNIVLRHGAPHTVITDRGKCFIAEFTQRVLNLLDVTHYRTTSYHPQTNGLCERLNHTLADMMSMYVNSDHKNWDSILPYITFAYNTSRQESTGKTPFFLLYGREATLPQDLEFSAKSNPLQIKGVSDQPEAITTKLLEARKIVHQKLHQIHLRQKARYDEQRREAQYAENDLVLVYKPFRKIGKSEKLLHRWLGPYKIIRRTSDLNYEVQKVKSRNNVTDIVHVTNLKPFNPPAEFQSNTKPQEETRVRKEATRRPQNNNTVIQPRDSN